MNELIIISSSLPQAASPLGTSNKLRSVRYTEVFKTQKGVDKLLNYCGKLVEDL